MRVKLSDNPRDWRRFVLQVCALGVGAVAVMTWRKTLSVQAFAIFAVVFAVIAAVACLRPAWFRSWYTLGMKASTWIGGIVAPLVLGAIFLLLFVPLGLVLRLLRHDPLAMRGKPASSSYWRPSPDAGRMDAMF